MITVGSQRRRQHPFVYLDGAGVYSYSLIVVVVLDMKILI
jgi:hypothetical protein